MKLKLVLVVTLLFVKVGNAQIYTPNGTIQGVSSNNNVGIGTSTPTNNLDILGDSQTLGVYRNMDYNAVGAASSVISVGQLVGTTKTTAFDLIGLSTSLSDGEFRLRTRLNGTMTEALRIISNGNVGIGTTAPGQKLDVNGITKTIGLNSVTTTVRPFVFGASVAAQNYGVFQKNDGNPLVYIGDSNGSATGGGTVNDFAIVNPNYGGHISLITTGTGNVGIGTTTPNQKLDINGITKTIGLNSITVTGRPFIFGASTAAQNYGVFQKNDANPLVYIGDSNGSATGGGTVNDFAIANPNFGGHISLMTTSTGNVGIGTTNPTSKLTVAGNINSREVKVTVDAGADFVFENNYNLPSLDSVDKFIKENKHLPEVASADEMKKNGINLSEMNIKLLQKIEELTLYSIQQNNKINKLEEQNKKLADLEKRLEKMETNSK